MKKHTSKLTTTLQVAAFSLLTLTAGHASAAVKFRIGFDASAGNYAVYMTPDSAPKPDMLLSAQITLVAPHGDASNRFTVGNVQSEIPGINWAAHSRVDAPEENPDADYVSLGYFFTGTNVPSFNWVAGEEKKVLTFTSGTGCHAGVRLIENNDPFNQLPNSANTNPGNDFLNVGWMMSNAYTGNYGEAVSCDTPPQPNSCEYTALDQYYLDKINTLETMRENADASRQARIDATIERLKGLLSCSE